MRKDEARENIGETDIQGGKEGDIWREDNVRRDGEVGRS